METSEIIGIRGQKAFSLLINPSGDSIEMSAELLLGAQVGRSDRFIFSRKAQCKTSAGVFKGSLRVILSPKSIVNPKLVDQYLKRLEDLAGQVMVPGAQATLANGRLSIHFPSTATYRRHWTKARSGNRYIVANMWIGVDGGEALSAVIPRGPEAFVTSSVIFEEANHA